MRRKDREITDIQEIVKIMNECKVCRIAMQDQNELYIVPMNYGYCYENQQLSLYFHSAKEGRKLSILNENNKVGFEMDCEHKLISADTACEYGFEFASIIGTGYVEIVEDTEEKNRGLSFLMKHQTGEDFEFNERMAQSVTVFKIVATSFTGKRHE